MTEAGKWGTAYWADLAERVLTTLLYGVVTAITTNGLLGIDGETAVAVIATPTVLSLLKGLLINLRGSDASPSLVGVKSTNVTEFGETDPANPVGD